LQAGRVTVPGMFAQMKPLAARGAMVPDRLVARVFAEIHAILGSWKLEPPVGVDEVLAQMAQGVDPTTAVNRAVAENQRTAEVFAQLTAAL
jgi:hypothetical protein